MKKKVSLIALLLCVSFGMYAHDFEVRGIFYKILSETDKTVKVTFKGSYSEYSNEYTGNVVIPEIVTYNGTTYSVTSIGDYAFMNCSGLTSVTIPNSVISIENSAFAYCKGLTSVIIPNSIITIGYYAFNHCSGLTSVIIPNSIITIGYYAFNNCSGLKEVFFNAENCTYMGSSGYHVFNDCSSFTKLTIGDKVKTIPSYAFYNCSGLTSIAIPNSVTSIGNSAFFECIGLANVIIGNGVESIGEDAFNKCTALVEVTIGRSVKTIDKNAFAGIDRLAKIYSLNPTPPTCADETVFADVRKDKCTLFVPVGAAEDYSTSYVWWDFSKITEKDLSSIDETVVDVTKAPVEYYNLQGVKVEKPEKGVYIKKQGGKTAKVAL